MTTTVPGPGITFVTGNRLPSRLSIYSEATAAHNCNAAMQYWV
jgi:hypothetical protein